MLQNVFPERWSTADGCSEAENATIKRRYFFSRSILSLSDGTFAELEKFKVDAEMASKALQQEIQLREECDRHVASLNRRILLLEADNESYQDKLDWAHNKLDNTVQSAEEANKLVKSLETKLELDDGELVKLEEQVATAKQIAEETGRKYEEAARKLALVEADLERAEERAEAGESKNVELEQEVKVVSLNLKSLEASEIQSCKSEDWIHSPNS